MPAGWQGELDRSAPGGPGRKEAQRYQAGIETIPKRRILNKPIEFLLPGMAGRIEFWLVVIIGILLVWWGARLIQAG